jgi:O-antigen/teichoic acid export membrane protein
MYSWGRSKDDRYTVVRTDREWAGSAVLSMGIINLMLGVTTLIGGAERFPPPTYAELLRLTNGSVVPYGLAFVLSGVLMIQRDIRVQLVGCAVGVVVHNVFAALLLTAILRYSDAGSTAWVAYGYAALNACAAGLIWSYWRRIRSDRRE